MLSFSRWANDYRSKYRVRDLVPGRPENPVYRERRLNYNFAHHFYFIEEEKAWPIAKP
jgi:hypothetical protein